MKIKWPLGIVFAFIGFIAFIMYFVVSASTNSKYQHDLVLSNYYEAELNFQNEINQEKKALEDHLTPTIIKTKTDLELIFPQNLDLKQLQGDIYFYRPSDKNLDFRLPLQFQDSKMIIPKKNITPGRWNIRISWKYRNQPYLFKTSILY